jgi:phage regulator Rha-like protein
MDIVEVDKNEVWADSSLIARKFGMQHGSIVRTIKKTLSRFEDFSLTMGRARIKNEKRVYRGQKFTAYLMNREMFSLVAQRLTTKKSLEWQIKFNDAFYAMEQRILLADKNATDPKWLAHREQGKIARLEETDVIKEFVDYATEQGSKSARYYYKHITNATYKALGLMVQKKPKLRDSMNLYEISELLLAERIAQNSLKKYMAIERNYKDIYESVKDDLVSFSSNLHLE